MSCMATIQDIKWGKYNGYSGPFYRGIKKYDLPDDPSQTDKTLAVITATEGGRWDAYNGYDVCISTSGLIQWCERGQYSVSDMLGKVADQNRQLIASVDKKCDESGLTFKKNARGRWRFFFLDERGEVDRKDEQRQMFQLNSNGKKGTWDDESKEYAKNWAVAISTVWENPAAIKIQGDYTANRLGGFCLKFAKTVVKSAPDTDLGNAFRSAYLSFAANNPTWADKYLKKAMDETSHEAFSKDWLIAVLQDLTFSPKVTIYPHRYNAIRPVLEKLYNIDLPDFAKELKTWIDEMGGDDFMTVKEIQQALIDQGFDLGPSGADGIAGKKTRDAVILFQQMHGIDAAVPGYVGERTRIALRAQKDASEGIPDELKAKVRSMVAISLSNLSREAVGNAH